MLCYVVRVPNPGGRIRDRFRADTLSLVDKVCKSEHLTDTIEHQVLPCVVKYLSQWKMFYQRVPK
jgi:hypothetical protein